MANVTEQTVVALGSLSDEWSFLGKYCIKNYYIICRLTQRTHTFISQSKWHISSSQVSLSYLVCIKPESCDLTVWNSSFYAWKWCSNKIQTNLFHTGFGRTRIIARQIAINRDVAHISSLNPAGDISTRALCGLILVGHNTYLKRSSHLTTPNHPLNATNSAKLPQWKAGARHTGVDIDHGDLRERLTYNNSSFDIERPCSRPITKVSIPWWPIARSPYYI